MFRGRVPGQRQVSKAVEGWALLLLLPSLLARCLLQHPPAPAEHKERAPDNKKHTRPAPLHPPHEVNIALHGGAPPQQPRLLVAKEGEALAVALPREEVAGAVCEEDVGVALAHLAPGQHSQSSTTCELEQKQQWGRGDSALHAVLARFWPKGCHDSQGLVGTDSRTDQPGAGMATPPPFQPRPAQPSAT